MLISSKFQVVDQLLSLCRDLRLNLLVTLLSLLCLLLLFLLILSILLSLLPGSLIFLFPLVLGLHIHFRLSGSISGLRDLLRCPVLNSVKVS